MADKGFRSVGKDLTRVDVVSKLTGQATFGEDKTLSGGLLIGKILRSPHPHALIKSIDTSDAEAMPGVLAVATAADLPELRFGQYLKDEEYFARNKVCFVGQRVAAVAAETRELAEAALEKIRVEYEPLPALNDPFEAMADKAPVIHPDLMNYVVVNAAAPAGGNICSENTLSRGEPDDAFASAHRVFEATYTTAMQHQAYIEPHVCLAEADADGHLTVYSSTQGQFGLRNLIAEVLGVPQNRVKVSTPDVGGGFGGKIAMKDEPAAAVLARKSGRPVRIVMTRHEDFLCGNPRAAFHTTIRTAVSEDMQMVGRTIDFVLDGGAHALGAVLMSWSLPQFAEGPYAIPNLRISSRCVYTNKANSSSFRAPGGPQANFALESETDRIAREMGWDPIAFRRKNLMPEGHKNLAGAPLTSVCVEETLDAAIKLAGYNPAKKSKGKNRGRGLGLGNWNVGGLSSGAVVKMNDDGSVNLISGVIDLTGVNTALIQVVSEVLGVPAEKVTVKTLDTDSAPHATPSVGSQALKSMGLAAMKAAESVRGQLLRLAVEDLDAQPEHMEMGDGEVRLVADPGRKVDVKTLLKKAMMKEGPLVGYGSTGAFGRLPSFCAHVADVEVDTETGQVKLLRFCASQDVGRAINPKLVDGQIQGGIAQGIGMALTEGLIYEGGYPRNAGFLDYKIPSALDLPMIETVLVEQPADVGPFGAKGVGEPPVVPVPAAIANAIYDAVGVRVTSLPITPEKLLKALKARQAGDA